MVAHDYEFICWVCQIYVEFISEFCCGMYHAEQSICCDEFLWPYIYIYIYIYIFYITFTTYTSLPANSDSMLLEP